jgi:chromate transporter
LPLALLYFALGNQHVFVKLAQFFSQAALVTFGGAYAVLAYVAQQAVNVYKWLQPEEMLVGLSMAETMPGPLIMVNQFVGFMGAYRFPRDMNAVLSGIIGPSVVV